MNLHALQRYPLDGGEEPVEYAKPIYSIQRVNAAGKVIANWSESTDQQELWDAFDVIDNWRAAHHFPLNTFYTTLKNRAIRIYPRTLTAQRIKRFASIAYKLWDKKDMKLSQMQDIGGCRAVMATLDDLNELRDLYTRKLLAHTYTGCKDYIKTPRDSGYRSVHLKYRFHGSANSAAWDGLKIEIQLRTQLQHQWATAVEAAGTFTKQALKSNKGPAEWLRFFSLMGSVFALREKCPTIPDTPSTYGELCSEIRHLNNDCHIVSTFKQYRALIPHFERKTNAKYYLITLDPIKSEVKVLGFNKHQSRDANKVYAYEEKRLPPDSPTQVVLVSVDSISALKKAYPNYFLDTAVFLREVVAVTEASVGR